MKLVSPDGYRPAVISISLVFVVGSAIEPARAAPEMPMFIDGKPVYRMLESGDPNVLRSEYNLSLVDEAQLRAYAAQRRVVTVHDIRKATADTTQLTYSGFHGTQIEYASADGRVYLWYPGNQSVLRGQWQPKQVFVEYFAAGHLIRRYEYSQICFRYTENSYNPATGHAGDGWECQPFETHHKHTTEMKRGDFLRLKARTEVPFILPKEKTSLAALRARIRN